jgi:hypothetical protein
MADTKMIHPKLVQLMPATRLVAIFSGGAEAPEQAHRVDAWGLYDNGSTEALVGNEDGQLVPAADCEDFIRLEAAGG